MSNRGGGRGGSGCRRGQARSGPNTNPTAPRPSSRSHNNSSDFPALRPSNPRPPLTTPPISTGGSRPLVTPAPLVHSSTQAPQPSTGGSRPLVTPAPLVHSSMQAPRPSTGGSRPLVTPAPLAHSSAQAPRPSSPSVSVRPSSSSSLSRELQQKLTVSLGAPVVPRSAKALIVPARPGNGTLGKKVTVKANHFLVQLADKDLHHYDVTIAPEVASKKVCRLIMQELSACYRASHLGNRQLAYDGVKNMYTAGELPFSSKDFVVKLNKDDNARREKEFKVSINFAAKPDLHHLQQFLCGRQLDSPQETIQALDVVLRANPSCIYTVVGRSFFHEVLGVPGPLGEGLEYWKGFYQSLRPTQMGLSLNIDVSARAFFEPILVTEFVAKYFNVRSLGRPLSDQDRIKIKKALRGIKIELTNRQGGRRYKVNGLTPQPLKDLKFVDDMGSTTSVVQYFRDKYKVNLSHTFLPAIQAGNESKPVYLPMELCKIVNGQRYTKKLNERQVTALLKATCQRPKIREESIIQIVKHNNYSKDVVATDFGIQVNCKLSSVDARVLPPPLLQYQGTRENPRVGSWNMINKRLVNGGTVHSWACVNFSKNLKEEGVEYFCKALVNMCREKGMVFNPVPILPHESGDPSRIQKTLLDIHARSKDNANQLQLLIIILPDFKGSYGNIKLICETEFGIVSQCCQPKQANWCNPQYLENLSLKINVKVGGRNTVLLNAIEKRIPKVTDRPTIIFGADVTHPSPGEDSSPSIAAVVASMDWPQVTTYRALVSAQPHRDEIIHDLYTCNRNAEGVTIHAGLIRDHLIAFKIKTGLKPHRIIFYRDGVSEGQFNQVLLYEVDAIRKACLSLEPEYLPHVTFVVVQKRHHTRVFPENHNDRNSTDKSGNILPGTVIDTMICHPTEFDFYLCSHAGIQGTSRPAHYHVLFDENNFTADELQSLTNNLCYTYARCTRSVSLVPPAYYAHLAAFRARYYMEGFATSDSESGIGAGPGTRDRPADVRVVPSIKGNVKDVMFYC